MKENALAGASPDLGFTLLELLAVLATLVLMTALLLPTLAKSGITSRGFRCLNNHRQLCSAWRLYAEDNHGQIVYASDDGTGISNPSNRYAWTESHMDFNPNNRGNWDTNYDITIRSLWPYTRNTSIYRCPSDPSFVVVTGVPMPRVRSVSMNMFVGGFIGTDAGWLSAHPYRVYTSLAQLGGSPGPPARIFVFLDDRYDWINWGNYMANMTGYDPAQPGSWEFDGDMPGMYHNGSCSFSFVDGHCEMKRWLDPRTTPPYSAIAGVTVPSPSNPDVYWLQDHSTRLK
jgi:prepilin-type processing-associated H-X9-DG protein